MIEFNIPHMSCTHCVGRVTRALQEVDPMAQVKVDLATKQVRIESSHAVSELAEALKTAGYPPSAQ